jgi:hypothetical protein
VTQEALKFYGYEVKVCWVCWSTFGPREMGDKSKPDAIPDISATRREPNFPHAFMNRESTPAVST